MDMGKTVLMMAAGFLLVTAAANAAQPAGSALYGETGIVMIVSAEGLPAKAMTFGIDGLYFYAKDLLNTSGDTDQRLEGNVSVTYGATDWLEVFLSESNSAHTITNNSTAMDSIYPIFGDLTGGVKATYRVPYDIFVGLDAFTRLYTATGAFGYQMRATGFGTRILATKKLDITRDVPIIFDFNLGYKWDNSRYLLSAPNYTIGPYTTVADLYSSGLPRNEIEYALGVYHSDQVLGAIGLRIPLAYVTPFVQYYTNQILGSSGTGLHYDQSPQYIIPGIRFVPLDALAVDLAVEIGITKIETLPVPDSPGTTTDVTVVPPWTVILGASYTLLPGAKAVARKVELPASGEFAGTVTDTTGLPLAAVISFNSPVQTPIGTDPETGAYSVRLPPGDYQVTVSAQNFTSQTINIEILKDAKTTARFMLEPGQAAAPVSGATENRPAPQLGELAGSVTDTTGTPLAAVISFNSPVHAPIGTDPETGAYSVRLPPGSYQVTVSAQNFTGSTADVNITENTTTIARFMLEPEQAAAPVSGATENRPAPVLERAIRKITIRAQAIHF
ncbi:MAG: carboxypeptidase-like regulatory domain-containing protein, partial [Deltaproteobacteria bacterium]|nr:carboxypeptidase-like regulatory domain-containing protein [Deltaproteobacteria bacterium]